VDDKNVDEDNDQEGMVVTKKKKPGNDLLLSDYVGLKICNLVIGLIGFTPFLLFLSEFSVQSFITYENCSGL
jgi:hypothetical protein